SDRCAMECNGLGRLERMRVPLPAARMIEVTWLDVMMSALLKLGTCCVAIIAPPGETRSFSVKPASPEPLRLGQKAGCR
ncbi:MAG: hypothetical protein AAFW82_02615, partial [Pseudomonadota bacterium]